MTKPVTILTGFLGAGKTTILNAVLAFYKDKKMAIIENEFGEQGIDAELIISPESPLFEMNNGCLCCSLNDNLYDILSELSNRSSEFDELLIETTGIADPAAVATPFYTNSEIKKEFPVKRVICLIDVTSIENQLLQTEEAIKQIVFSDILLLNKTTKISPDRLAILKKKLQDLHPFAAIFEERDGFFDIESLFAYERDSTAEAGTLTSQTKHHHHHHGDIVSLSFVFDEPFNEKELQMALFGYLLFETHQLYRIKGIVAANNLPHKLIIQSVGQNLSISGGKAWPIDQPKRSRLVFIGKNLEATFFENLLKTCLS
jgi:G3E family GTPase